MDEIRGRALARLRTADFHDGPQLLRGGYVYRMVLQHEYQHGETILQTLQLKQGAPYRPPERRVLPVGAGAGSAGDMVFFPGGTVELGTDDRSAAYDNERPRHRAAIAPFWIDVTPVTNRQYLEFIEAGGYVRRELWSDEGWRWLEEVDVSAPKYWANGPDGWTIRTMDLTRPLDPVRPVCHVCYHEAEAYARFAGKRLPTEAEWEAAASWDPTSSTRRIHPWGDQPWTPSSRTSISLPSTPPRSARTLATSPPSAATACWVTSGSGPPAISAAIPGSRRSPIRNLRGVLRPGIQGPSWRVLGYTPRRRSRHVS